MDPEKLQQLNQPPVMVSEESGHHLRLADLFRLSLRVFRVRRMRTFLTILGISMGIGTVLFLVSLGYGLQYVLIGKLAATEDSLISLEAFYPAESNLNITGENIQEIINLPETAEISPIAEFTGEAKSDSISGFLIVKIANPNYFRLSGISSDIGSVFTEEEKGILVSATALKLLGMEENANALGQKLAVKIFYQQESEADIKIVEALSLLTIKGIISDEFQPPFVIIPASAISDKPPFYQKIFIKAKGIESVEPLRDKLIAKGLLISARIDLVNQAKRIMSGITIVLGVFGVAALLVSAIGMFNTMIIGFLERIFEVGIMKSIGATASDIRNLFLMESLIIGLLGGIGGILIGVLGGEIFNLGLNFLANRLGGKPVSIFIYPTQFLIFIVVLSGIVGISSGFWPARKAALLSPKQAFLRK